MGEKRKPRFSLEDPEAGSVVLHPEDYEDYEYSADGDWLTIYFGEEAEVPFVEERNPEKRVYWIRYE